MGITAPELRENSSGTAALFVPCFLALTRFRGCRMTVSVKNVGAFILSDTYMPDCQDHHLQNVIRISPVIKKQEMIGFGALMCLVVGECKQKRNKFVLMGKLPTALEQMKAPERWLNVSASSQINHRGRRHDPVFIRHECKKKKKKGGGGDMACTCIVMSVYKQRSTVKRKDNTGGVFFCFPGKTEAHVCAVRLLVIHYNFAFFSSPSRNGTLSICHLKTRFAMFLSYAELTKLCLFAC